MKKLASSAVLAACALVLSVGIRAQEAGSGAADQERSQTPPTFRVQIDLVTTDVIARDDKGQFVADLKKEDFEVFEDGVKQEVASLVLVHGGRVFNQLLPPPPAPPEGIILPPSRPRNDAAGRIFLFIVDDLHLDFRNTPIVRRLFKRMADELVHEGDMFGIVSTGTSSISIDLTYDRSRLEEAANKISGGELRYRAHVAFSTAYDVVRNLEKVQNRRKAIVYVSSGYDLNPFEGARYGDPNVVGQTRTGLEFRPEYDPFTRSSQRFADADLIREMSELTRAANRANATIYTLDPRGLVAGAEIDENIDPVEWQNFVRKSQESLRTIAELTGGFAVVNQNDFTKALRRIDNETSDYYVVGYYSSNPDPLRRTRQLEVKTSRKNVEVWSRRAYSLRLPPEPKSN
jgi:VWFA-related protein